MSRLSDLLPPRPTFSGPVYEVALTDCDGDRAFVATVDISGELSECAYADVMSDRVRATITSEIRWRLAGSLTRIGWPG
jgi:hypothetical protein